MTKKKNIHEGHRERLVDLIVKSGLENVSEVQAMEYICTLVIPRKDVNPLAHELLNEFGNIANVLDAEPVYLMRVKGMTELAAKKMSLFKDIFNIYKAEKINKTVVLKDMRAIYQYVQAAVNFYDMECIYMVALDSKDKIIAVQKSSMNSDKETVIQTNELAFFISKFKASKLLLFHNHPNGDSSPSPVDIRSTNAIEQYCGLLHTTFADHIIVGKDEIFSFKKCAKLTLENL